MEWTIGDPRTAEGEAADAAVDNDWDGVEEAVADFEADSLNRIAQTFEILASYLRELAQGRQ